MTHAELALVNSLYGLQPLPYPVDTLSRDSRVLLRLPPAQHKASMGLLLQIFRGKWIDIDTVNEPDDADDPQDQDSELPESHTDPDTQMLASDPDSPAAAGHDTPAGQPHQSGEPTAKPLN